MTNPNDQAYPMAAGPTITEDGFTNPVHPESYGLTKREYFAAMAMQALVANSANFEFFQRTAIDPKEVREQTAITAIQFADALILALNQPDAKESK